MQVEGGFEENIAKLNEEVKMNTFVRDRFPQELEEKAQWIERLREVLQQPTLSETEKTQLQNKITSLRTEIAAMNAAKEASNNHVDEKLGFYRQQYSTVDKKKQKKEGDLKELLQEQKELENELKQKESKLEELDPTKV
jgi:chromosome segregation ATPase